MDPRYWTKSVELEPSAPEDPRNRMIELFALMNDGTVEFSAVDELSATAAAAKFVRFRTPCGSLDQTVMGMSLFISRLICETVHPSYSDVSDI